jgi:putative endonuclease
MYTVYIIYSQKIDQYYTGYTNNIERRLSEHNRVKGKFTDRGIPWELVYAENYQSIDQAKQREMQIKLKKSRKYIQELIGSSDR